MPSPVPPAQEVARFYSEVVSSMPERLRVVVDDITSGDPLRAGLVWWVQEGERGVRWEGVVVCGQLVR